MFAVQVSKSGKTFIVFSFLWICYYFDLSFSCTRCFLRARGYIYLQKTPDVLRVWILSSHHSSCPPQLDIILDWPRIHTRTSVSRSHNYSSHGKLPPRRWCHSKCVVRYSSRRVRYHVFCVRICQLDGVCRGALCTNEISGIKHEWGMLICSWKNKAEVQEAQTMTLDLKCTICDYYMVSSVSGQDGPNRGLWLATRAGKMTAARDCPLYPARKIFPKFY